MALATQFGIENTNRLVTGEDGVGRYPGIIGIKNGYTSQAGHTLISAARCGGRTLLVTVMNPQHGGGFAVYEEARTLLDWGFPAAGHLDPVGSLRPPPPPKTALAGAAPAPTRAPQPSARTAYAWPAAFLVTACLAGAILLRIRRHA